MSYEDKCQFACRAHAIVSTSRGIIKRVLNQLFGLGFADFKTPVSLPGPDSCCGRCAVVEACNLKAY